MRSGSVSFASSVERVVVFDLDGTVAVGDEPVLAYLRGVAGDAADAELAGWAGSGGTFLDGYALVVAWADAHGVPEARRSAAYAKSRAALHDGDIPVTAPEGLAAALARRPVEVRCVLVTNAPVAGIEPLLDRLGVTFDSVIGDAGKPGELPAVLDRLLQEADLPPERLLSVGDLWVNDLAPAAAIGATTAYVDRFGRGDGAPTFRAGTLTALLPGIEAWWSASAS